MLTTFANSTLGKSYANSRGTFLGECVSYIHYYCQDELGIDMRSVYGNAVDYWDNPSPVITANFNLIPASQARQDGDIIVWGDDAGTFTNKYGHIAIAYKGQILNQNYGGNRIVTINPMFTAGLRGYLRHKGGSMLTTKTQLNNMYTAVLRRTRGTGEGEDVYLNKDSGFVFDDLYKSPERATRLAQEAADKKALNDKVASLSASLLATTNKLDIANKEIATLKANPVQTGTDATAKDTNEKVNWIVNVIKSIFNR